MDQNCIHNFCHSVGYPIEYLSQLHKDSHTIIKWFIIESIIPKAWHIRILVIALCEHHQRQTFCMVNMRSKLQLANLNTKTHGGQILRDLNDFMTGASFYPPQGSEHYKFLFLHKLHEQATLKQAVTLPIPTAAPTSATPCPAITGPSWRNYWLHTWMMTLHATLHFPSHPVYLTLILHHTAVWLHILCDLLLLALTGTAKNIFALTLFNQSFFSYFNHAKTFIQTPNAQSHWLTFLWLIQYPNLTQSHPVIIYLPNTYIPSYRSHVPSGPIKNHCYF